MHGGALTCTVYFLCTCSSMYYSFKHLMPYWSYAYSSSCLAIHHCMLASKIPRVVVSCNSSGIKLWGPPWKWGPPVSSTAWLYCECSIPSLCLSISLYKVIQCMVCGSQLSVLYTGMLWTITWYSLLKLSFAWVPCRLFDPNPSQNIHKSYASLHSRFITAIFFTKM